MSFLLPFGLLALLTLPIVLVLHLIGDQRRRQVVPSLLLWRDVPLRPDGIRWRMLPLSLLLLLHVLAAGLLALALGQPQMVGLPTDGARHTAIVLDTSMSMATREGNQSRLDLAKARAKALIAELRAGDRVTLVSAGPHAAIVAVGDGADAPLLNAAVDQLQAGGVGSDIAGGLALAEVALDSTHVRRIMAISDGALLPLEPRRVNVPFEWVTVGSDQQNRAIVAFAARPWAGKTQVYARIANYSGQPYPTTLRLFGDGQLIGSDIVPLDANGEYELTWSLPATIGELRAELDGGDVLAADDWAYVSIHPNRPITTLLVSAQPAQLQRALAAVPGMQLTIVDPAAYDLARSATANLTVFDGFLPAGWPSGAILVVNPPTDSTLLMVGALPQAVASDGLVRRGALLDGLSFSGVTFGNVRPLVLPSWATPLLAWRGDVLGSDNIPAAGELPLVARGRIEGREVAIWSFDLAHGNLPARLAFPSLVLRTVRDLTALAAPSTLVAGGTLALRPDPRATQLTLTAPDGGSTSIIASAAGAIDGFTQPGWYRVAERDGEQILYQATIGVNSGSTSESRIAPLAPPPITGAERDSGGGPLSQPMDLWPWLAGAALAILAVEWLIVLRR
jgi:hypothetical protein